MFLRTLGALELEGSDFHWSKPLLLLTYLALEGPQDRRRVARLFWPEAADPMNSLTVALSQLRKGASGTVEADRKLVQTPLACDAQELCEALQAEALERTLELYRGPFLDGFHLESCGVELEEWLYEKREHLAGLLRRAVLRRADTKAMKGQFALAAKDAEVAEGLREAAPLVPVALEHLHVLLLAGESPRAEAVREEAEAFSATLPRSPKEARAQLLEALNAPVIPCELPRYDTPLVGRSAELDALEILLARSDARLITVVGPGGIGKTRLATTVAEQQVSRATQEDTPFPHGVYFVPLAPVLSAQGLVPATLEVLGIATEGGQKTHSPKQHLIDYLQGKRLLLLLDNFEHLLDKGGAAVVSDLLQAAPGVKLLVTSRERLKLHEEQVLHIWGLELPGGGVTEATTDYPAADLFCQRARRIAPDFRLNVGDAPQLQAICRLLEGMPLGLELAATWVDTLPLADIAAGIRRNLDFLEAEAHDVPERHWSIRAVFDHTYERLGPQEQTVFAQLSVFRGGFTREAAANVAGASPRILSSLVSKSLLHFERTQNRYHLHELLRQYGGDQLVRRGAEEEATRDHHSSYFFTFLQEAGTDLIGPDGQSALAFLEADSDNVQAAWHWAVARGRTEQLDEAADALGTCCQRRGRFQDGARAFEAATKLPRAAIQPQLRAKLLAWQGVFGYLLGKAEAATRQLEESLALLDEAERAGVDVRMERAFTLLQMGRIKLDTDAEAAERLSEESLALYRALDASAGVTEALSVLGEAAYRRGNGARAGKLFEESLTVCRMLGDRRGVATLLPMLSFMAMYGAQFEEAAQLAEESYALCRRIGDRTDNANGLSLLGMSYFWLGKFAEARSLFEESLALYVELGTLPALPQAYGYVGLASMRLGRYEETRTQAERGLRLARELGSHAPAGWCLWLLGDAALGLGRYAEAKQLLQESVATYRDIGQQSELDWSLAVLCYVERALGRSQQARHTLVEVLSRGAKVRDFPAAILALPAIALLLADEGHEVRAVELDALTACYPVVKHCHWFEDLARRHLAAVAASLPPEAADGARARGSGLELWNTVDALLDELHALGWSAKGITAHRS